MPEMRTPSDPRAFAFLAEREGQDAKLLAAKTDLQVMSKPTEPVGFESKRAMPEMRTPSDPRAFAFLAEREGFEPSIQV